MVKCYNDSKWAAAIIEKEVAKIIDAPQGIKDWLEIKYATKWWKEGEPKTIYAMDRQWRRSYTMETVPLSFWNSILEQHR